MSEKTKIIERKKNPTLLNQLLAIPFFTVICITYYNLEAIYDSFYFNKSRSLEKEHDNNFEQCSYYFCASSDQNKEYLCREEISTKNGFFELVRQ